MVVGLRSSGERSLLRQLLQTRCEHAHAQMRSRAAGADRSSGAGIARAADIASAGIVGLEELRVCAIVAPRTMQQFAGLLDGRVYRCRRNGKMLPEYRRGLTVRSVFDLFLPDSRDPVRPLPGAMRCEKILPYGSPRRLVPSGCGRRKR